MAHLPMANLTYHKLRSVLSAIGIGIAVCMLITLSGLARGTLHEVADRWEAVDAELIIFPPGLGAHVTTLTGIGVHDRVAQKLQQDNAGLVERVVPVFLYTMRLGGQDNMTAGVDADHWPTLSGKHNIAQGRLFEPKETWEQFLTHVAAKQSPVSEEGDEPLLDPTPEDLYTHGWTELVIDSRLAAAGGYEVGQTITAYEHRWKIVGIVPAGGMARIYMPRRTAQFLFGSAATNMSTLMFVKLRSGADAESARRQLRSARYEIMPLKQYRILLEQKFGVMFRYIDAVNIIALVIAFLFIMITLYTMVLQRTREIAILRSCGASNAFILRQVLWESLILTFVGAAVGIVMSLAAAWLIETTWPLYTVTITWQWIGIAILAAVAGAVCSAVYPAWQAARVDVVAALTLE